MNWLLRTLAGAVVAGMGWKLGADAYEAIKKKVKEHTDKEEEEGEENGAGATQTHTVDVD